MPTPNYPMDDTKLPGELGATTDLNQAYARVNDLIAAGAGEVTSVAGHVGVVTVAELESALSLPADTVRGAVGDGVTDDAPAIQDSMNATTYLRLEPGKTYLCDSVLTVPSDITIDLAGSTLKAGPGIGDNERLVTIDTVSNVTVRNGEIDGDKASYAPTTEYRHNIYIVDSDTIKVHDIYTHDAKGDGLYVGGSGGSNASTNITVDRVVSKNGHRQGLSVTAIDGGVFTDCEFRDTIGTAPQCGLDIEPNGDDAPIDNLYFNNCKFTGNENAGVLIALRETPTLPRGTIEFHDCTINGNHQGIYPVGAEGVKFFGGQVNDNEDHGVFAAGAWNLKGIAFDGVDIKRNGLSGVQFYTDFERWSFVNCTITDNGTITPADGIEVRAEVTAASKLTVLNCTLGNLEGATQTHGIKTTAALTDLSLLFNTYPDNATAARSLADDEETRLELGEFTHLFNKSSYVAAGGTTLIGLRVTGEDTDRLALNNDGSVNFSTGSAVADTALARLSAGVLGVGGSAILTAASVTTWTAPTLLNSWANYGGSEQVTQHRKDGDVVQIDGNIKSGSGVVFVLPVGSRPPANRSFICPSNNGYDIAYVVIQTSGNVTVASYNAGGNNSFVSLDGITFSVTA